LAGKVILLVVVDASGKARDMKAIRPLGLGLDEKAIEAVGQWTFQPGMKDGQVVAAQATIEVEFRILEKRVKADWHLDNISFKLPAGALRPHVLSAKFPGSSEAQDSFVTVSFEVDERGKPVNLHADASSDPKWEAKVLAAVKDWRFDPGMKDSTRVVVPCTVRVVFRR
jgi:TonB family protein